MVPTQISCFFYPNGFLGRFFLASVLSAFLLLAVAQLRYRYPLWYLRFLVVISLAYQNKRSMVRYVCILPVLSACLWGFVVQSCGHPSLTGVICLYMGFCGPKLWTPQPNWRDMFVHGVLWSKVVDTPA